MSEQWCQQEPLWQQFDAFHKEALGRFYSRAICMLIYFVVSGVLLIMISRNQQISSKRLITIQLVFLILAGFIDTVRNIWMLSIDLV